MASAELFKIAQTLDPYIKHESREADVLIESATEIGKSWSGSWFGYHSRVYYENFEPPPPGAVFSQEWGLMESLSMGSRGAWHEYRFDDVVALIEKRAGNPSIEESLELARKAEPRTAGNMSKMNPVDRRAG